MLKKSFIILSLLSLTQPVFADNDIPNKAERSWEYVAALSLGAAWPGNGISSQTLTLAPEIVKTYTHANSNSTLLNEELFIGAETPFVKRTALQLGLSFVATSKAKFNGDIWDDASAEFNNYDYDYMVQHTHIAAKGKLLFETKYRVLPWISASAGVGWNTASFTDTPTIPEALVTPFFADNTITTFTYTVGAGIQYPLTEQCQVGIGYEFADWGKSQSGKAAGQLTNERLSTNHLYTNGVMVNLTYLG